MRQYVTHLVNINSCYLRTCIDTHRITNSKSLISCEGMTLAFLQVYATLLNDIVHAPTKIQFLSRCNAKIILFDAISRYKHLDNISTEVTVYILSVQKTESLTQPPFSVRLTTALQRTQIIQSFICIRSNIFVLSVLIINPLTPFATEIIIKDFQHLIISQTTLL